ncbi:class I SAM-dependent methyltransferase [Zhihengliuella sp.]|uniref:class I SAM-dependent methyltransferase n=1 Tax=Zhihengliuella sp. TaxID=1954483 RepID=UPI002811FD11|nr:class I SAM-dependent methyltransferase [Zhihengliuella sp.]
MGIDFADPGNRRTYAARRANTAWADFVGGLVELPGARVADIGCGGGIYSTALLDAGAAAVVGVDGSAGMVSGARERAAGRGLRAGRGGTLDFAVADAADTGLEAGSFDVVLQRALIHHVEDLRAVFVEARRILRPDGMLIVQDRTMDDVARPGSPEHPRGYFFERYPRLLEVERARRPAPGEVEAALSAAGFDDVLARPFQEVRREYASVAELAADLRSRTGRSILHELDDAELDDLVDFIAAEYGEAGRPGGAGRPSRAPISEQDHWTVWTACNLAPEAASGAGDAGPGHA